MEFEPTVSAVNMYQTYKSWWFTGILYLALGIILALAIFEEPAASASYLPLPFYITVCNYFIIIILKTFISVFQVTVEILCLGFFMFRLAHEFLFSKKSLFWKDAKHIMILIILALTLIDICIYTGLTESGINTVRWSRILRPLLIVNIPEGKNKFIIKKIYLYIFYFYFRETN